MDSLITRTLLGKSVFGIHPVDQMQNPCNNAVEAELRTAMDRRPFTASG